MCVTASNDKVLSPKQNLKNNSTDLKVDICAHIQNNVIVSKMTIINEWVIHCPYKVLGK